MIWLLCFVMAALTSPFKSKIRLEAENAALRHQLIVLRRKLRGRVKLASSDRWFFIQLFRWFPSIPKVLTVVRPETLVRWHRAGFRSYWRWKSRSLGGRPLRRECLDHILVLDEEHLRRVLKNYAAYYNGVRTHRSLQKDAPVSRPVQRSGAINSHAILGGLHHQYVRI
jgi:hypothetical protein